MKRIKLICKWGFWKDEQGQDLIEYALMAGFVALAAATILPNVTSSLGNIFNKLKNELVAAGG